VRKVPAGSAADKMTDRKTVGIIGGMGPLATCDFFEKIVRMTDAATDQEHLHIIIDNETCIPDRSKAVLNGTKEPVEPIVNAGRRLINAGAELLVMSCNTAHCFYDDIAPQLSVPLIHMPRETAKGLKAMGVKKAGLLSTVGLASSGVYNRALAQYGIETLLPEGEERQAVMDVIFKGVKASNYAYDASEFKQVLKSLKARGADALIMACTEIPLAFEMYGIEEKGLDPAVFAAAAVIKLAGGRVRQPEGYILP